MASSRRANSTRVQRDRPLRGVRRRGRAARVQAVGREVLALRDVRAHGRHRSLALRVRAAPFMTLVGESPGGGEGRSVELRRDTADSGKRRPIAPLPGDCQLGQADSSRPPSHQLDDRPTPSAGRACQKERLEISEDGNSWTDRRGGDVRGGGGRRLSQRALRVLAVRPVSELLVHGPLRVPAVPRAALVDDLVPARAHGSVGKGAAMFFWWSMRRP
jgi:hypothetical protein